MAFGTDLTWKFFPVYLKKTCGISVGLVGMCMHVSYQHNWMLAPVSPYKDPCDSSPPSA